MKKNIYFTLLVTSLLLISCGPVDMFGKKILLENTESSIVPEKELYSLSDDIKLFYFFDLDPDKFYEHEYYVSTRILKNGKEEICDEKVLVYDENENNVTSQLLTCLINENKKITKQFILKPQEPGNYIIVVGGYAYTKGSGFYEGCHIHYLNVQ